MGRLPAQHVELLEWARERYGRANSGVVDPQKLVRFAAILEMAGSGRQWWSDENADSYVNRLRDGGQGSGFFFRYETVHIPAGGFNLRMAVRGDDLITSALTPGELLLKPLAVGDRLLADQYERMLFLPGVSVVPFTERAARIYGTLRADKNLRAPDAIQLASAAAADMLVTNDARLSRRIIPGIHFVTSLCAGFRLCRIVRIAAIY